MGRERYEGVLAIPEQQVGAFAVRHLVEKAGTKLAVRSARTTLYGGHRGAPLIFDHDTVWHELSEDNGVWTTDLPIEQAQQRAAITGFRGRVLIGGLGVGLVVQVLTQRKSVSRIDVVERAPEVVQMVAPHVGDQRMHVYQQDLFEFLRQQPQVPTYHAVFFDI